MKSKYSVSWSMDSSRIYLYEDIEQINEVEIIFSGDMDTLGKQEKVTLLKNIIKMIEKRGW